MACPEVEHAGSAAAQVVVSRSTLLLPRKILAAACSALLCPINPFLQPQLKSSVVRVRADFSRHGYYISTNATYIPPVLLIGHNQNQNIFF